MKRGALLFAFNSPKTDYYAMAEFTAKRINHFLNLPVTIVTDAESLPSSSDYRFDKTVITEADTNNNFRNDVWINKGRYQAFQYSPYDETLLLDVDYMVNSDMLLKCFDITKDYSCHGSIAQMMRPEGDNEYFGKSNFPLLWATVVTFQRTKKAEQLFNCMEMIQKNYRHYADLFQFNGDVFRNDIALTLSHKLINGQLPNISHILPWNLMHIWLKTKVFADSNKEFNTEYTVVYDHWKNNKVKKEYIKITDMDFHVINKEVFQGLMI